MGIDIERWQNRTGRFLVLLVALVTFGISAANLLITAFDLRRGFHRNWRWWAAVLSWLALFFFAREMFLLWKGM